jgi:hypothetical protein
MSIVEALVIAVLILCMFSGILLYVCIRAVNELLWVREDLQQASDAEHAKCVAATMAFVGDEWAAQILTVAADDYESPKGQQELDRISRLVYKPGGSPLPSIWLRERADRLRIMIDDEQAAILEEAR